MSDTYGKNIFAGETLPKHLSRLSVLVILVTLTGVIFRFDMLRKLCVCISNLLVWSWIAFGIAAVTGIIYFNLQGIKHNNNKTLCPSLILFLNLVQSLAFVTGLVFLILFGALLANVI
jgi:hypothetical protein